MAGSLIKKIQSRYTNPVLVPIGLRSGSAPNSCLWAPIGMSRGWGLPG